MKIGTLRYIIGGTAAVAAIAVPSAFALATDGAGHHPSAPVSAPVSAPAPAQVSAAFSARAGAPQASGSTQTTVPVTVRVPAGNTRVATLRVIQGVLVYTCQRGAWTFSDPEATMGSNGAPPSVLYTAGPEWVSTTDGSAVWGTPIASADRPGTVPALLVRAVRHRGNGWLSRVTYIQRLRTAGGLPPAGRCTPGSITGSRYTAKETFWVARSGPAATRATSQPGTPITVPTAGHV
jgi:Protein of unknown function (DUF3455)